MTNIKLVYSRPLTPETTAKLELKDYLKKTGWFVRHVMQRRWSYKGMPDIMITKHGLTLEVEVKSATRVQSPDQIKYEKDLTDHGGHYVLARGYEDIEDYLKENKL